MTPYRVYRIAVACAVLHNICISLGEPEKEEKTRSRGHLASAACRYRIKDNTMEGASGSMSH